MESKIIFFFFFFYFFYEIEVNFVFLENLKKYGLPPGSACSWSKARPWEPRLYVAASLVLWLPPPPVFGLSS